MKLLALLSLCTVLWTTSCHKCKNCKKSEEATADTEAAVLPPTSEPIPEVVQAPPLVPEPKVEVGGCRAWSKSESQIPDLLSKTACFDAAWKPSQSLIPYEVNFPFWSDGSDKARWMVLPEGTKLSWNPAGLAVFPKGSLLIKEFTRGGKKIETRFMVHHSDETWVGYSYEWNPEGTDAKYIGRNGKTVDTGGGTQWAFPGSRECMRCHSQVMNYTLGFELPQINVLTKDASGAESNQILDWQKRGIVVDRLPLTLSDHPRLYSMSDANRTVAQKARDYLHANCSFCHRPGSQEPAGFDLRVHSSFADMKICNIAAELDDLAIPESKMFVPLKPELSIVHLRVVRSDYSRMPPLASLKLDEAGGTLLRDWINATPDCLQP